MMIVFRCIGKPLDAFGRCVALLLLSVILTGCAGWHTQEQGFRDNELEKTAQAARGQKPDKPDKDKKVEKPIDYWSFSEKGRQIERDLAPQ